MAVMQPVMVCLFLFVVFPILLFAVTYIFRQACVLCGLPKPSVGTAIGVMLLIRVCTTVSQAVMDVIVMETCRAAGLPRWEGGIIVFFLLLPIDLLISAGLHAGLMNIKFGKGLEVWFVQMLIYLTIFLAVGVATAAVYFLT